MTCDEVKRTLEGYKGQSVRITFDDGVVQIVTVNAVDDEGVLHSGPDGVDQAFYWTRFDSIVLVERKTP
jgi:hypothetical protein